MTPEQRVVLGRVAVALMGLLLAADLVFEVALSPLFALAPVIGSIALRTRHTTYLALTATLLALVSDRWNDNAWDAQHVVRVVDVALMSAVAVSIAWVRRRSAARLGALKVLAEVAQYAVLPVVPSTVGRTGVAVRYESGTTDTVIGGDLYDCYHSSTHIRFLIGDVRGKGIEAVEQSARVIRAFRQAAAIEQELETVAVEMSRYLQPFFSDEEFVTALLLDTTEAGRVRMVNAGHPAPLLVRADGSSEFVERDADLPLGLGLFFATHEFTWEPGDRLLLYTDGVTEARDRRGEFFDLGRHADVLTDPSLELALTRLLECVRDHSSAHELGDDVAVMLMEHSPNVKTPESVVNDGDWLELYA
ncbi:PP2C family protein-serine/threonine phosphatase [Nocardioides jishulii]|uniref:Serine/threonine-protein phosphatase n=1 Tax=Nocardioides jishulii TaxID=2575440 RepID=A0A4U2YS04_9ACTN|nr:PP2C family protein-serine/threonine phosphatase [Nocardioides jishulii]QCX28817.1 serine/threonine-protein phosphatase [Nocardioides jishulii]TKI64286.1 serine/threonine-protein phosphatase [Nocardioides jishulii]